MLPPLPRCSGGAYSSLISPRHVSLPRKGHRVGPHIVLFEACSAFTRVAACTLARSPIRDPLSEGFRHFVSSMPAPVASGWSESPGGARTHWKTPPYHGAHPLRTLAPDFHTISPTEFTSTNLTPMTGFTLFSLTPKEEKQRRGCNPLPEHYVKCWKMTRLLAEKMSKPWEMLESYVEFVYQSLLDLGNDNVVVGRDVTLTGRTGIPHQIDVYYEFEKAGFRHRVAIECRHKSRAI